MSEEVKKLDILESYKPRVINGLDKMFIPAAEVNYTAGTHSDTCLLILNYNDEDYSFKCVHHYFQPLKRYYKLHDGDSCEKICSAFGIKVDNEKPLSCMNCFKQCIENKVGILKQNGAIKNAKTKKKMFL